MVSVKENRARLDSEGGSEPLSGQRHVREEALEVGLFECDHYVTPLMVNITKMTT